MELLELMFQIAGAFAEYERTIIRERINAGLARARKAGKVLGCKQGTVLADPAKLVAARCWPKIVKTVRTVGLGTGTVHRLKQAMA